LTHFYCFDQSTILVPSVEEHFLEDHTQTITIQGRMATIPPYCRFVVVNTILFALLQFYLAHSLVVVRVADSTLKSHRPWQQINPWKARRLETALPGFPLHQSTTISTTSRISNRINHYTISPTAIGFGLGNSAFQSSSLTSTSLKIHRQLLEELNDEDNDDDDDESSSNSVPSRSLKEILKELSDRDISFSPMSTKAELEELLLLKDSTDEVTQEQRQDEARKSENPSIPKKAPSVVAAKVTESTPDETKVRGMSGKRQPMEEIRQDTNTRLQRRQNRKKQDLPSERVERKRREPPPLSTPRQRRQERRNRRNTLDRDYLDDNYDSMGDNDSFDRRSNINTRREMLEPDVPDDRRLRRRLRRQQLRQERRSSSLLGSISDKLPVEEIVDIGTRAGRIAKKKTGQIWKDIVDYSDYDGDENGFEYYEDTNYRQSSQPRSPRSTTTMRKRRSGFNWQQDTPREGGSRQQRRFRRNSSSATIPAKDDYYSNQDSESRRDDFPPTNAREQRRKARRWRDQRESRDFSRGDIFPDGLGGNNDVVAVKQAEEDDIEVIEVESISPEDWQKQQEERLQQRQKEQEREVVAKQQQATNKTKKTRSRSKPSKGATSTTTSFNRSVNTSYRPSQFSATTARAYGTGAAARQRRKRQPRPEPSARTAASANTSATTKTSAANSSSPPPLPKSDSVSNVSSDVDTKESSSFQSSSSKSQEIEDERTPQSRSSRRIYSPYGNDQSESSNRRARRKSTKINDFGELEDEFDRVGDFIEDDLGKIGDFLASSVDNIFWGKIDDIPTENIDKDDHDASDYDDEAYNSRPPRRRQSYRRHWKDRAEERLDRMMGVYKEGTKTYDRWAKEEATDYDELNYRDYADILYGKKGKQRRKRPRKTFWEDGYQDDSTRRNLQDLVESLRSSNSLTIFLQNLVVVAVRVVESLCKWASVRDTIPKQLVFCAAIATGLVSQSGNRIKNTLLTILSARVLGEWLNGRNRRGPGPRRRSPRVPRRRDGEEETYSEENQ